jgi:hypothetical protein
VTPVPFKFAAKEKYKNVKNRKKKFLKKLRPTLGLNVAPKLLPLQFVIH